MPSSGRCTSDTQYNKIPSVSNSLFSKNVFSQNKNNQKTPLAWVTPLAPALLVKPRTIPKFETYPLPHVLPLIELITVLPVILLSDIIVQASPNHYLPCPTC